MTAPQKPTLAANLAEQLAPQAAPPAPQPPSAPAVTVNVASGANITLIIGTAPAQAGQAQ